MSQTRPDAVERSVRGALNRDVVVLAALEVIDEHGLDALSMRTLGERLGVKAMSLYTYVTGREDLLEAVVAHLLDGLIEGMDEHITESWQGYLTALAHQVRGIAVHHPAAFPLVATRHPATPWLRPPLRSVEIVEDLLGKLSTSGFSDDQLVDTYRAFSSFLLGQLLLEAATRGAETSPDEETLDEGGADVPNRDQSVDISAAPIVNRLRPKLSEDRSDQEFEIGLETLVDRLESEVSH